MSPGFKSSLAALAVAGLLFAPVMGTNIAYADDTSTNTVQTDSSSQDAAAKAAADKKAQEEADAAKAKADKEAADKAAAEAQAKADAEKAKAKAEQDAKEQAQKEADAKKAADEASAKAEVTPSATPESTAPVDPPSEEADPVPSSPSPTAQVAAKVASTKVVAFDPVKNYVTEIVGCAASGVDIKAGAPDLKVKGPGDADAATYKAGDELRWNTSASSIDVYLAIADDSSNNTTLTIAVKQGEECKTEVTPSGTTQVGNVVTVPNDNGVIYRDQDGKYLEPGDYTLTADNPTLIVKAEPDQFFKFPAGDWTWTHKYQAPDADKDGYTDAEEQAAGSDPNDPKSTPVDLDGDGVLNDADKCANTAADAKVDKDGCSADQLDNTDLKKVELCHATGSDSNPYTDITVSVAAFYNAGHVDHSGDIWAAFSYTKKGVVYNVAAQGDQSILANGCVKPKPKKQYALVLWKVDESRAPYTSGMPLWPQDYTKSVIPVDTKPTEATIKAAFPAELKGTQKCVAYQGDGYEYTTKSDRATVDGLIAGGVLTDYADSSVYIAHAYYVNSDCTTYYDAPTIRVWDQKCVVGDQGVGQYTDGGFVVTAADKVSVVVKDGDDKVVTDTSSVKPGVYTVFATAPKGGAWNKLPDGWSYVDESKTVIKTVVTVKAAKDCSVQKPPPDPSTYVWGQETWKCYDTQAVTKGERIDYVPTWIEGAWVQVAQPPVPVEKTRVLTENEIVKDCTPQPDVKVDFSKWEDGKWKCYDTSVLQTQVKTTTTTPYIIKWNEDGTYSFVLDTANAKVENETLYQYRQLTADEIIANCQPEPYSFTTETDKVKGDWKCGDTEVVYTWWLITWRVDFELVWFEDGSYTFVEKAPVETGRDKQSEPRPLTDKELAPCDNGGDNGPKDGANPAIPWALGLSLLGVGVAFFIRRRMA